MTRIGAIIEAHGTGLLATVDQDGDPHLRWLTPDPAAGEAGGHLCHHRAALRQGGAGARAPADRMDVPDPALDEIVSVRGSINVVENPSLRAEVLEVLGPRLRTFWKLAHDARDLVVLETVVEEATHFLPMEGRKEVVQF